MLRSGSYMTSSTEGTAGSPTCKTESCDAFKYDVIKYISFSLLTIKFPELVKQTIYIENVAVSTFVAII